MTITLAHATLATLSPRMLMEGYVTIRDGRIHSIGPDLPDEPGETVDCAGKVVIPGNVCAHTHLYSALARGMPGPPRAPANFPETLEYVWWRLDRSLDEGSIRSSGQVGVLDAVRAGTTTLVDHHASPNWIDGSLDVLADACDEFGLRGLLCYEVTDRGGRERSAAGLRENERFIRSERPRVRGMVGAHAGFTLEDGTLEAIACLASRFDRGIHIHLAEDACDELDSIARCGRRAAFRLDDAGILGSRSIAAHGVHLDERELQVIADRDSWLVHNCRSNMNNSVGRARPERWGPRAALGTDGIDGDMFAESRTAFLRGREADLEASADRYGQLLAGGAALVSEAFDLPIGVLAEGAAADLVILRYDSPTPLTTDNLAWHWMFALGSEQVESVMVDGAWVLRDGVFPGVDEERIRAVARREAERLWQTMEAL